METIKANETNSMLSKVPQVTIFFWIIKILCTTVGETFSDFLSVNIGLGLTLTTIIMGIAFVIVLYLQFKTTKYVSGIYWVTVVLISVFGTLVTDNLTDGIGVPLELSTLVFSVLLGLTFLFWYLSEKTLSIHSIYTRKRETFYWLTILFTFALGTAVGDLYSEQLGLGYLHTGIAVAVIIACSFLAWKLLNLDSVLSFWVAYIFTRPLGASLGDFLSQPKEYGGLGFGTTVTSVIFLVPILAIIVYLAVTKCDTSPKIETVSPKQTSEDKKKVLLQTITVLCTFLIVGIGGYVWYNNKIVSKSNSSPTSLKGQLTDFIKIENDMLNYATLNNFTSAKTKAEELEHDWDTSEPKLRNIDSSTWIQIDGTIDSVLSAVRSKNPDVNKCKTVLQDSLNVLNESNNVASLANSAQTTSKATTQLNPQATSNSTSQSNLQTTSQATSTTKLKGRLTDFITIENDMLNFINSNNFTSAKTKADELEHDWDTSEPKLRKVDSSTWIQIDGTIDSVLSAVRSNNPNSEKCKAAIQNSTNILNSAN
ncbi:hypothetical protein [Desulfosporosinus sp. OT]|uniref:COG4705 family protein n=1 Tax=Desulfosporosinus sp. OT TaxID=913865 RepID=UPI000223B197|nr:hypothetical protein [Desulfosporosinus sp. OT]EGW41634.1 hypothetical protein DOT_0402 [Desulfosporosinus sp. OT]